MTSSPNTNPLIQLLQQLPKPVRWRKRQVIKAEMVAIGKFQHYRQSVLRCGWKFGDTHVAVVAVLMRELGLTLEFFTATAEEQHKEVEWILDRFKL